MLPALRRQISSGQGTQNKSRQEKGAEHGQKNDTGNFSSPRKGANTDIILGVSSLPAQRNKGVHSHGNHLSSGLRIHPCKFCVFVAQKLQKRTMEKGHVFPFKDGMDDLSEASCLRRVDSGIARIFWDDKCPDEAFLWIGTEGLLRHGFSKYKDALSAKVAGAFTVGGNRNAGEEFTLMTLQYYFQVQAGHDCCRFLVERQSRCYIGGGATTFPQRGRIKDAVKRRTK